MRRKELMPRIGEIIKFTLSSLEIVCYHWDIKGLYPITNWWGLK